MLDVATTPANPRHFGRLMAFAREVLEVCAELGIEPIVSGSLAVFAYTENPTIEVHDVDLSCSESDFPRLRRALEGRDIDCRLKSWHVLQAVRDGLKIEFDSAECWMRNVPERYETVRVGGWHSESWASTDCKSCTGADSSTRRARMMRAI
jgi:hypothetical protein